MTKYYLKEKHDGICRCTGTQCFCREWTRGADVTELIERIMEDLIEVVE